MALNVEKISDLEFNKTLTLFLIEKDEDLREIFTDDIKLPFSILHRLVKEDRLNETTSNLLLSIFENVILTQSRYVEQYLRLSNNEGVVVKKEEVLPEKSNITDILKDVDKPKKENGLPRRYGKNAILLDITNQDGKPTNVQLAALAVNDLKNTYVNLSNRLIKDMLSDEQLLTDTDYRDIISTVKIVQSKLKTILKKKS